jgi:CRP-like cAMP-binding protein
MLRRNHYSRAVIERLRNTSLFCDCSDKELRLASALVTEVSIGAGRLLTRQGTVGNECFVIMQGQAVVERSGAIVGHAVAGSIVGEIAVLHDVVRTATVICATDVRAFVMSRAEVASLRSLGLCGVEEHLAAAAAEHLTALRPERPCDLDPIAARDGLRRPSLRLRERRFRPVQATGGPEPFRNS